MHAIPHLRRIDVWLLEERCRAAKECVRCFARATAVAILELRKVVPVLPTKWPFPASSCTRSKRRGSTTRHLACWAIASLVLLIYADVGEAEAIKVAISQRGFWDSSFVEFATRQGFFKDEGIEVQPFYTEGGAGTLDAVMSGSVDIAMSNGLLGALGRFAKGAPIRVVAAEMTGASDAFWYARADSEIKALKDAAGKSVAFSSPGSSTNLMVLALVKQAGVEAKPLATGGAPGTLTQVMTRQVDIGWSVPPFGLAQVADGAIAIVAKEQRRSGTRAPDPPSQRSPARCLGAKASAVDALFESLRSGDRLGIQERPGARYFAEANGVPLPLARSTREFYPKEALQMSDIKGLDLTLRDATAFKYTAKLLEHKDIASLFDVLSP